MYSTCYPGTWYQVLAEPPTIYGPSCGVPRSTCIGPWYLVPGSSIQLVPVLHDVRSGRNAFLPTYPVHTCLGAAWPLGLLARFTIYRITHISRPYKTQLSNRYRCILYMICILSGANPQGFFTQQGMVRGPGASKEATIKSRTVRYRYGECTSTT